MQDWFVRAGIALLSITAAHAAGIDCTKARSPTEKAICATPSLRALDQAVAEAYADALARAPDQKDAARQDLLRWLKQRDTACALPSADIPKCLTGQLTERLAALAPPAATAAPVTAGPAPAAPAAGPLQTAGPAARPADPAIPNLVIPPGAATLDQASVPASEHAETLLHVASAGRFTIAAHSASGASLQLVDIMTGPGDEAGVAGAQDGRLDPLLDVGTYKLRLGSAKGASGDVKLTVMPFHDAAPPAALPPPGFPLAASLRDGEQRGFWLRVPPSGEVRIEAAGRALADLQLWRDGRELSGLEPVAMRTEPAAGHPLTDLRIEGRAEPGTYLAVAYGGATLPWTDNDPATPFLLRAGLSPALAEGVASGPMGPFGSEVYALPPAAGLVKLSLPASAAAELRAGDAVETLTRTSREPFASLEVTPKTMPSVEVRAGAGQAFALQALEQPSIQRFSRAGTYWVSAAATGAGGDELPPGFLLERTEFNFRPPQIVANTLPRIGPGAAWHARFNLRGETRVLVQNTAGSTVAVRATGVAITQRTLPNGDNLAADVYQAVLTPEDGALGSLDLVIGPPGVAAPLSAIPSDPVIPLGIQTLQPGQSLVLHGPSAPGLQFGLLTRPLPVALAEGPLTVTQLAGTTVAVPVALAPGGTLAVSEVGGGPVAYGLQGADKGQTVVVPITDRARTIVLAWRRTPATPPAIPAPTPMAAAASIVAGTPVSFDLARNESRGFALTVPEGGLYRLETLGRLHTAGRIASAFVPRLNEAEANGVGQNMLLQQILRAGRYRVDVTAKDSAGHLGVAATPAPVLAGATLTPGGSVRATVPAGSAAAFPLVVAGPGERYRLEVASLGAAWQGRIEDAGGWPLTRNGPLDGTVSTLPAGSYRLVVTPDTVDRQVVARLAAVTVAAEITGHGPHALPFEAPQAATWREPDSRDQPRTPDSWTFSLAGPAEVTLSLGKGMTGDLHRVGGTEPATRVVDAFTGMLEAGAYRLDAGSLGRNDRLAYTAALTSKALQPGVPKTVELPSSTGFAIATPRVVSLTTFGNLPVKAVLRRADGSVVARTGARMDDWNIAASRLLDAGAYTLDLAANSPPTVSGQQRSSPSDDDSADKPDDDQEAQSAMKPREDAPAVEDAPAEDAPEQRQTTELLMALPDAQPVATAPSTATALNGAGVHVLSLPQPAAGTLVVAQAASTASLVLALERQSGDGWRIVALDEGTAPLVASPADDGTAAWRIEAWTVDGGTQPIRLAARAVAAAAQPPGLVALAALDGVAPLAVARVGVDGPVAVSGAGLLAGGWPGQALAAVNGPVMPQGMPQGGDIWLLGRTAGPAQVAAVSFDQSQAMVIPPGQSARLPAAGQWAVWRADGGFGQPSLGGAAGIAGSSAVARANAPVTLRNASADGPLRVTLTRAGLTPLPSRTLDAPLQATLPPGAALPLRLPSGDKAMQLQLGAGVAAFAGGTAAWAGDAPLSRTLYGDWTDIVLVNLGASAAPAGLAWQSAPVPALQPGGISKRSYGAAGSFELAFTGPGRLSVAGDAGLTSIAADGTVARGRDIAVAGAGRLVVEHGTGPVAVWLATDAASPWPSPAPTSVQLPAQLALAGPAMALAFTQDAPALLHVSTTAPVFASLAQAGRTDPPRLFAAGAELHVALAPGPATLTLFSTNDGPLSGSVSLASEPVTPAAEGLGAPVAVAPGGSAAFGFSLVKAATIGVGIRAEPDRATVRLLDAAGVVLGEGVAQLRILPAGRYVIEAQIPADASTTTIRPAVVGITPRGSGPPPDVVQTYLDLAGLKPQGTAP